MKFIVINGSPRGQSSNTRILLSRFLDGYRSVAPESVIEEAYLKGNKNPGELAVRLHKAELVLLAFPLYTDAMPGIVKNFIEQLDPETLQKSSLKIGFLVQSGFPEAHHSTYVERYLVKLTRRLGLEYLGTIVRGGVEGIKMQPRWMTRYTDLFYDLGQNLALDGKLSPSILKKLRTPEHLKGFRLLTYKFLRLTGLSNFYWNYQLKENNVFDKRYAKPYTS